MEFYFFVFSNFGLNYVFYNKINFRTKFENMKEKKMQTTILLREFSVKNSPKNFFLNQAPDFDFYIYSIWSFLPVFGQ